ncbi:RimJ/RimL family protein N-acetyltransferase [Asanoa ferruginea]|uniref:RimJ/RimL family protein N-acetyltransferase n=1 Tax=Asanoa ferruginea TaxID=53367 RepID=A0A3D9ZYY0_9ACTN|nr:GNAT family N-acetyltransferase [Asanoa ferruginea]REG02358.1 RimJ/RimL family protein N-acetyltransferase [Asanoa ferruginea]GIF46593.1 N-acetyltransferase [Asanoa ferruginea]
MRTHDGLVTERILLRRWHDDDLDAFAEVTGDPEVMRWIGDGRALDREATAARLDVYRRHWEEHGFGLYALVLRQTGELAGFTGLAVPTFLPEILPAVEIGWRLGQRHWGQGLATEAARAVVAHARADLGLDRLVSIHQVGNDASANVMIKLGMHLDRETLEPGSGRAVRVYALDL